ncbi:isoprenylcysteine carboxylmethyltransferase family protein [Salinigranum sp.]|uniref:methyltransferase family protein n=1 Tax=Salinigranum sp. TaxID=1966351 RepID=UPI003566BDC9
MFRYVTFAAGLLSASVVLTGLVSHKLFETFHFWPPEEGSAWTRLYTLCSQTLFVAILVTGVLDWSNGPLLWNPVALGGLFAFVVGMLVTVRSASALGADLTRGEVGELYTDGPYRYSRNPQYVGYMVAFAGYSVFTLSPLVAVLAAGGVGWMVLMTLIEESWLRRQYGDAYVAYRERTPRLVGIRSLTRLLRGK